MFSFQMVTDNLANSGFVYSVKLNFFNRLIEDGVLQ
jgi:hypothetical protein